MNWMAIVQLLAGAIGGNAAGTAKQFSLGPIGNSLVGLLGGVGGGHLLSALIPALSGTTTSTGGFDTGALIGQLAGSGVGGAVLTLILGFLKQKLTGTSSARI